MIPRRFVVRVVKHIVCFITLAQALDSLLICCPGCRTFAASFVDFCLYIFSVLTRIKLVAFSNLLNLSHINVKQMGASVSTQFCPSHFNLVLTRFLFYYQTCPPFAVSPSSAHSNHYNTIGKNNRETRRDGAAAQRKKEFFL